MRTPRAKMKERWDFNPFVDCPDGVYYTGTCFWRAGGGAGGGANLSDWQATGWGDGEEGQGNGRGGGPGFIPRESMPPQALRRRKS